MTDWELRAWLRLAAVPRTPARRMLSVFGSAEAVLGATRTSVANAAGAEAAAALFDDDARHAALHAATVAWLDSDARRTLIPLGDPRYPPLLLDAADPPLLLHAQGDDALLQSPAIAIVGSRHPTPQGVENAQAFAAFLGKGGWTIVSGLALGIDAAAHGGALDADAATIAVIGTGLDRIYPRSNEALFRRIAERGLLLSEYPVGTPPLAHHFPQRNRIIAGLARGTLVVEAALRSGSLITARLAAEAGREVFAIPGSIHAPQARGCHALIRQGAKLVESGADVLEELPGGPAGRAGAVDSMSPSAADADARTDADASGTVSADADASGTVSADADGGTGTGTRTGTRTGTDRSPPHPLLSAMGHDPIGIDELVARTGTSAAELSARLLDLELAGHVDRLPGQRFQRMARA